MHRRLHAELIAALKAGHHQRRLRRVPAEVHVAADGVVDDLVAQPVLPRPRLAEGRERGDDQPRVLLRQRRGVEAERRQPAGRERLDQHIGVARQLADALAAGRLVQVGDDRALVGVQVEMQAAGLGVRLAARERPEPAHRIARRRLDLQHLRAEVRQQLRAVISGHRGGEIEHPYIAQRCHRSPLVLAFWPIGRPGGASPPGPPVSSRSRSARCQSNGEGEAVVGVV